MNGFKKNPYALYVYCDGAMDYDSRNSGGVGFQIEFPDVMNLIPVQGTIGKYVESNIERLELEAIRQGMNKLLDLFKNDNNTLKGINTIIFITDRYGLNDSEKTNAYKIREWRKNDWCNYEGKAIKNSELLDSLDKLRKKITIAMHARVEIQYGRRKFNKVANKLAKKGKTNPKIKSDIAIKGLKIGKRKFDGDEVNYKLLKIKEEYLIHVYKKEAVGNQYEISVEVCEEGLKGKKLKIYVDYALEKKLKRKNQFRVKIKTIRAHHITIYKTIKKINITDS